ncbi:uncharacterized protein V1518DRAFT_425616 [Limtongia smithiae]|uniref:uncharacterized protein n=1 Tax=Limtongia smithiae TaxID=1125753 RepID=UPI0034CFEDB1
MASTETGPVAPAIVCIGMAGSGKTTFVQRLNAHLHAQNTPPYVVNLDPAVLSTPFDTNIDIRDSVNYKEVMKQYNLGPNGAIITSLNLFATKIDQVLGIIEKRAHSVSHIVIDTPGQIEAFVWSASGAILLDALASAVPTVIAYIVDTPRTTAPATFMSNMLYACSILYKTKLPLIIVFNKTDVRDAEFATEWMTDFESFQMALKELEDDENAEEGGGAGGSGYMNSLMNSMSLVLEEFYRHLDVVSVSAYTGAGFDEFLAAVDRKVVEFNTDYKAEVERLRREREEEKEKRRQRDIRKLMQDMGIKDTNSGGASVSRRPAQDSAQTISDAEAEDDDDDDDDEDIYADRFPDSGEAEGILDPDDYPDGTNERDDDE